MAVEIVRQLRGQAGLRQVPGADLGPAEGGDLSLLVVAADPDGIGVAGVGLAAALGRGPTGVAPLVAPGHPLLEPPGRPSAVPGVLTLDGARVDAVIGVPSHLEPTLPALAAASLSPAELDRRCGLRA